MKRTRKTYVQEQEIHSASARAASRGKGASKIASHATEGAQKRYLLRSIMHGFTTIVMVIAIALAAALVGVRLIGYDVYTVLSGSMEPTYHTGSVIYVKPCEAEEVQVGDPITFVLNEDLVVATHRVIDIDYDEGAFYTKGDANAAADGSPVLFENLIGKPVFSVPYLGYVAAYVQEPPGMYVAIAACALLIMLTFLPDLFAKDEDEEEDKEKKMKRSRRKTSEPEKALLDDVSSELTPEEWEHIRQMRTQRQVAARQRVQVDGGAQQQAAGVTPRQRIATQQQRQAQTAQYQQVQGHIAQAQDPQAKQQRRLSARPNNPRLRQQAYQQQRTAQAQDRNVYPLDDAQTGSNPRG